MTGALSGKRIAVLVTDGFEESELVQPLRALQAEGAEVDVIAPHEVVQGMHHEDKAGRIKAHVLLARARSQDYEGLVLPGGLYNPDRLRCDTSALRLVRSFFESYKPVAAISHAPWVLIDAGVLAGRTLTSHRSLKADLVNAGAHWIDREVIVDKGLVSSRGPDDLAVFCRRLVEQFAAADLSTADADAAE